MTLICPPAEAISLFVDPAASQATGAEGSVVGGDVDPRICGVVRREAGRRCGLRERFGVQANKIGVLKRGGDGMRLTA